MSYNNKLELSNFHLHLTGAQTVGEIQDLAVSAGVSLENFEPLDDEQYFDSYAFWAAAKELTSDKSGLLLSIINVLDREKDGGCSYVELTLNPDGMLRRGMSVNDIVEQLELGYSYGQKIGVKMAAKFGVNRKDGKQSIPAVVDVYEATSDNIRFGIDLNGDERRYPTDEFMADFLALKRLGVLTTIHAGEHPGTDESLVVALDAEPTRIGHAVIANVIPGFIEKLAESRTTIEVALTSNLWLGSIACIQEHPLLDFLENDIPVVFGTDDPGIFGNTMFDEILLAQQLGLSVDEVVAIHEKANMLRKLT